MAVAIAQFTIKDLNDITTSTTAPSNPTNGQLWLDTSTTPNVLKKYNGSSWEVTGASSIDTIGGTNLIQNSNPIYVWYCGYGSTPNDTITTDALNDYINGIYVGNIRTVHHASGNSGDFRLSNVWGSDFDANTKLTPLINRTFTFSAWIKSDIAQTINLSISDTVDADSTTKSFALSANTWTKIEFTKTYVSTTKTGVRIRFTPSVTSNVSMCLAKLEEGNKATSWQPAPEDAQGQIDALNDFVKITYPSDQNNINDAIYNATSQLAGAAGGYVVIDQDDNKKPYEILIMDTPDRGTAKNVWRWNSGGLGFSSNGYNGPYTTAITSDGKIVADFITTGTLLATLIKGGTLTLGGGTAYGNGSEIVRDEAGNIIGTWDSTGITINKGTITGSIIDAKDTLIIDGTSDWAQLQFTSYWNKNGYIYANDQRGLNFDGDTSAMFNLPLSASFGLTPQYTWSGTIPVNGTINITHNLGHTPIIRFSGYRGNVVLTTGDDANANVTTVSSMNAAWTGKIYFW